MKATEREKRILYLLVQGMSKEELIDAIAGSAKLTKADAGRVVKQMTEDELMKYVFGLSKEKLIDAIASGAKLTKADAGRALDVTLKKLKVVFGGRGQ